jgi:hypothetical protein
MASGILINVKPALPVEVVQALPVQATQTTSRGSTELGWFATKRRNWHRNSLKRTLARIIEICKDHEANGLKAGDPIFKTLHVKSIELCDEYCQKWNLDRNSLETELPSLRQLRLSAHPENLTAAHKGPVVVFGLLAIVALPLIIGVWTGLFGVGQRWIAHLFGG